MRATVAGVFVHRGARQRNRVAVLACAGALLVAAAPARAQSLEDVYRGATVRMVSSNGPASGYTLWARFIAQYLGRHIPGEPNVAVETMGGAGGLIATNWAYSVAPKDGKTIVSVVRETPSLSVLRAKGAMFDARKFGWLGSPSSETNVCAVRRDAPWKTLDDAYSKELVVGTDGVGSGLHIFPVALDAILGMKFKVVDGYADSGAVLLAVDRGEIHGSCQSAETLLRARGPAIAAGDIRVVLQAGLKPDPRFPAAPFIPDLAKTREQRQALQFLYSGMMFGRPFLTPPGVPPDRVAMLQRAFADTFADPDFRRDAKAQGYAIDPTPGAQMAALVDDLAATPQSVLDGVASFIEPPGSR